MPRTNVIEQVEEVATKYTLSSSSKRKLVGLHPDLRAVVFRAIEITEQDFTVLEGLRTKEKQRKLVSEGKSQTMDSRHLTGHAVDIAPYGVDDMWAWKYYWAIEAAMKQAAEELGVDLEWGGDWKSFKDGPHWQLSWKTYPND